MMKKVLMLCSLCLCLSGTRLFAAAAGDFAPEPMPSLVSAIRVNGPLDFCGEVVPLENPEVRERLEKELLLLLWNRPQVILWLKRASRYFPFIEKTLARNRMPDDLKYLAVAESALLPNAGSSQGAVGFWQFIKATGLRYGLVIDDSIDQRRNLTASTEAAAAYLKDLYDLFGSWTLAAAAYNMGEERLKDEKTIQQVESYYEFSLPAETERYIFKILSIKLMLANPGRYGFHLQEEDFYPPQAFDRVRITLSARTPIYLVAQASDTYFKQIKDLNPELTGDYLPKGGYIIAVPQGAGKNFHSRFAGLAEKWQQENSVHIYTVKKGDNLSSIAERFNVSLPALLAWNDLNPDNFIRPGEKLVIYQ